MKPRAINLTGEMQPPSLVGVMVLLDRSGSMKDIRRPMVDAFKQFLDEQKAASPDGMWLSLHQFDSGHDYGMKYEVAYDRKPLAEVHALVLNPGGGTPLRDALHRFGQAARDIIADEQDETERLVLVVITDGGDNTPGQAHGWDEVRELMLSLDSDTCETIWLGTTAALLEVKDELPSFQAAGASLAYAPTEQGVQYMARGMSMSVASVRSGSMNLHAASATYLSAVDDATASAMTDDALALLATVRSGTKP